MRGKKLLAAFLLGVGLCFVPVLGYGETEQGVNEVLTDLARRRASEPCAEPTQAQMDDLVRFYRDWYESSLRPALMEAETNDAILENAKMEFLTWLEHMYVIDDKLFPPECYRQDYQYMQKTLFSRLSPEFSDGQDRLRRGLFNAIEESHERCVSNKDPHEALVIGRWIENAQAVGVDADGAITEEGLRRIEKCLRFELDFDSTLRDPETGIEGHVRAEKIPITLAFWPENLNLFKGEGPLRYISFLFPDPGCVVTIVTTDAVLNILFCKIVLKFPTADETEGGDEVIMAIAPSLPSELVTIKCPDDEPIQFPIMLSWWLGSFSMAHQNEITTEPGGFQISNWSFPGTGAIFAQKIYGPRSVTLGLKEKTDLTLRHVPVK